MNPTTKQKNVVLVLEKRNAGKKARMMSLKRKRKKEP